MAASTSANSQKQNFRPAPVFGWLLAASAIVLLGACSKPVEKTEDIRPVRAMTLAADRADVEAEFAGEVRPRVESRLGFRVPGKIIARRVDVGTMVKKGQVLMQLDPQDLALAQAGAKAGLAAAASNRDLAAAELKRYQELRAKNFVSEAVLDAKNTAFQAAQASWEQANAALNNQANQSAYASLVADVDGVVTSISAEVGQVVAAGTPVVNVAQLGAKDVVFSIPEDKVDKLRKIPEVSVRTWAQPDLVIKGSIREISPIADPVTRTYAAKVAIPGAGDEVKLGMTAYVSFRSQYAIPLIKVPMSALVHSAGSVYVWVVENGAVKQVPVQIGTASGNDILLTGGVTPGQKVVTAGANMLKPGQKVLLVKDEGAPKPVVVPTTSPASAAAAAASASAGAVK